MSKPLVFNIQKYSVHDGEGIRTTVFFKGCPISCRWCHNPESQRFTREFIYQKSRCTGCGACIEACGQGAIRRIGDGREVWTDREKCVMCTVCMDACVRNAREAAGDEYEIKALVKELEKDRMFYEQSGGGVTLSGGEALAQDMDYIEQLAKTLYDKGYSVNIDTCGHVPYSHIQRVLPYVDTFLYDVKLMDPALHRIYTGVDNSLILENLKKLSRDGGRINIRIPLIKGVNANGGFIDAVIAFLKGENINVYKVNLLKYHATGSGKYEKLGRSYEKDGMDAPEAEWLEEAMEKFKRNGFTNIQIGG